MTFLRPTCGRELDGDHGEVYGEKYGVFDVTLATVEVTVAANFEKERLQFRFAFVRFSALSTPEPVIQLKG